MSYMDMGLQGIKAAFFTAVGALTAVTMVLSGNLFMGSEVTLSGTAPVSQIVLVNGTIPDATTDSVTFLGAKDTSSDSLYASTLSIYTETIPVTEDVTPDTTVMIRWNGSEYKLRLEAQ